MKKFVSLSLPITAAILLNQCATVETLKDFWQGDVAITNQTEGPTYYKEDFSRGNLNSIAAKIDNSVVTRNEINFMLSPIQKQLAAQFPRRNSAYRKEYSKAKQQIFDELIDRELILNEFTEMGASLPPREIDREIKSRINGLYNGKRSLFLADLKKSGLSQAKYRSLVERTIAVGAMKAQHLNNFAPPTTSELQKEYSKFSHKLRDISKDKAAYLKIWIPAQSDEFGVTVEDQLKLAEDLAKKIRNGASFRELAKKHSKDFYAKDGGQWPMTNRIDFPVHFAPVVFEAPINKVIGPLADEQGFHIIKVTRKINGPSPPMSKVRKQLEQRVVSEKSQARFKRWIGRLRNKANIVKYKF